MTLFPTPSPVALTLLFRPGIALRHRGEHLAGCSRSDNSRGEGSVMRGKRLRAVWTSVLSMTT